MYKLKGVKIMSKEILLEQIEMELGFYKNSLKQKLESLQNTVDNTLKCLNGIKDFTPNSLGIVQLTGQEIDVLCGKIYTLQQTKKY